MKNLPFLLLFISVTVFAQEKSECRQKVVMGENLFKQGLYSQSEATIKQAIDNCRLSRKNRQDAYEILTRLNIETDNIDEANKYLKKVIRLNPNYQPNPARVEEDYIKYFSKYRVSPVLTAGIYSEVLFPKYVNVGKPNEILDGYDYSAEYESRKMNSVTGVVITLGLPTNTRFSFAPGIMTLNYKRQINHTYIKDFYTLLNETDKYLNIPLELNQHFKINRFTVYGGIGYTFSILRSASGTLIFNYPKLDYDTTNYVDLVNRKNLYFTEYSSVDLKPQRQNFNLFRMNAGVTYNISSFIIDVKFSYSSALQRLNSDKLYLSQDIVFRNYYIDNNFYVKYPSVSFSVSYIIFHKITRQK
jgi:tetratricopeptide (TPR) repeat protein